MAITIDYEYNFVKFREHVELITIDRIFILYKLLETYLPNEKSIPPPEFLIQKSLKEIQESECFTPLKI